MLLPFASGNGRRTVYMPVTKRSDASTLTVVDLVKANLPKFKADLDAWIKHVRAGNYSGKGAPRVALVSPAATIAAGLAGLSDRMWQR